eukprot:m.85297 g.85297  ORF g.85297 m.85297 type:complete len:60 (+) comp14719_c1_seq1:66-245(+)
MLQLALFKQQSTGQRCNSSLSQKTGHRHLGDLSLTTSQLMLMTQAAGAAESPITSARIV